MARHGRLVALGTATELLAVVAMSLSQAALARQISVCVTGDTVADVANPGQISDCEAPLEARDTFVGTGLLNWSENTPITNWDGIRGREFPVARRNSVAHYQALPRQEGTQRDRFG